MLESRLLLLVPAVLFAHPQPVFSQETDAIEKVEAPELVVDSLPSAPEMLVVPALTPVSIEILADLASNTSKSLETFPIRLAEPIEFNGVTLVPAGVTGMGEVVHAKKAGGSGSPGELILAARYLEFDGRQLPLRSLRFAAAGESKIGDVNTMNTVAAATVPIVSVFGFFMKGGDINVASGTVVHAKTAKDFKISQLQAGEPDSDMSVASEQTIPKTPDTKAPDLSENPAETPDPVHNKESEDDDNR